MTIDTLNKIARDLSEVFPELEPLTSLSLLGEGFNSLVVQTPDKLVFRIGKTQQAHAGYLKEMKVLPFLQGKLPLPIPQPRWYVPSVPQFPFGLIGYPKLPGQTLRAPLINATQTDKCFDLAWQLARFLLTLHRFSPQELEKLELEQKDTRAKWEALRSKVLPALRTNLTSSEYQRVTTWWEEVLLNPVMVCHPVVLQHGDLWYENLLVEEGRLSGVLDFEQLALGDLAADFAVQLYLGETFTQQLIRAYQGLGGKLDQHLEYRMPRLLALRELEGLAFAVQLDDWPEIGAALSKIRRSCIFI